MAKLADYQLKKSKMLYDASNVKPERPRFDQQLGLEKSLADMQKEISVPDRQADEQMFGELSQKWKGNGGGGPGDAFISGLTAGIKKGSFTDDKKRSKQLMQFTEQMRNMVAEQNMELYKQEKLSNARNAVTPRIMAYLESYGTMSPNDRKVYLQDTMEEYNKKSGVDYKLLDATGSEPWKVIVSDGEEAQTEDLMDFIKMPEDKKLEYLRNFIKTDEERKLQRYFNSNEVRGAEQQLQNEDMLDRRNTESQIARNQSRISEDDIKRKEHEEALQVEKEILEKNGDNVKFIDNMSTSGRNAAERHIKEYTEKANQHLASEKRLTRAVKIAEDHPELFGNLNAIIAARYNENPSYLYNLLKNKIPSESLDAMSELSGIIKNIFVDSTKGTSARAMNMFLEKKLEAGSPNQRWTAAAFKKVVGEALEQDKESYDEEKKVADYGSQGLFYRPRAKSRKKTTGEPANKIDTSVEDKLKAIPGLTKADIDEAARRLQSGK